MSMKIPAAAMAQMNNMIRGLLPYESEYSPTSRQGRLINGIFSKAAQAEASIKEWEGFAMFLMKKIDESKKLQKSVDDLAESASNELLKYLDGRGENGDK